MKKNIKWVIAIIVLLVVVIGGTSLYQVFTETHAVVQVTPKTDEASTYKGMFVLHGGEFSADELLIEESYPTGFARVDQKGSYASPVLFDGQRSVGVGHLFELILPKKISHVTFVALSPEGNVFATPPLPIKSHALSQEQRVSEYDLEVDGVVYFEVHVEPVGFVNDHHNQFSEFK